MLDVTELILPSLASKFLISNRFRLASKAPRDEALAPKVRIICCVKDRLDSKNRNLQKD